MTQGEAQEPRDGEPRNAAADSAWAPAELAADFGERAEEHQPHLAAYPDASDRQALRARVKLSASGRPTLVTAETRLRDGDRVYVESGGRRKAHLVCGLRRGLRSRDPQDLRIAQLREIDD